MIRFVVTLISQGNCYRREEIAKSETDAVEMAKSRIPFSSDCRVFGVKCIGRCA